ncbi:MAG TPA: murein transglycosylase A [Burkholderiales bacterium]|nr:murein transglycosylase A [Burkholderiales bacterium]
MTRRWLAALIPIALAACQTAPTPELQPMVVPPAEVPSPKAPPPTLRISAWNAIDGWPDDDLRAAWSAFLGSCSALGNQAAWQSVCGSAANLQDSSSAGLRQFFELNFTPYQVINGDGSDSGLITGYYEPLLRGSRTQSKRYRYPIYAAPDDLLTIDLSDAYPELKSMRLRGRLDAAGRRIVPYYDRAQIEDGAAPLANKEIVWVDDSIDLFFLQIQGSGRVKLDSGETIRVGYADQNGYPYRSIGRRLVDLGELPLEKASMEGIRDWADRNPDKLRELLDYNASYVFFRELPVNADATGPIGALGVALTPQRSLAVDTRAVPLGAPVFLATTWPNSTRPLKQLMLAQDTGGAIRGGVRADFFWGFGGQAAFQAGSMRQSGKMWVLLPNNGDGSNDAPQQQKR